MKRAASIVLATLAAYGTLLFAIAYHGRYWLWRDCFNELGRCYDPERGEVFLEQAGLVWGMFAAACFILCLLFASLVIRRR